jgi:hypothetical protein
MTDTTEAPSPADDIRARNKATVFAALAAAGIHRVTVDYDGSGDSGQIENIEAWNAADERMPFPTDPRIQLISENAGHPLAAQNLEAAVESVAWDYLDDLYNGWENNDGAFGTFAFDVAARSVSLERNERFTDVNTSSHQF